jgi:hypothetical protein
MKRRILFSLIIVAAAASAARSYYLNGPFWPSGTTIPMYLEVGSSPALTDGCPDWSCPVADAIDVWNVALGKVQLKAIPNSTATRGKRNGRNDVFSDTSAYDYALGTSTLAVTTWWYQSDTITEADICFNSALSWDSYRGDLKSGSVYDFRRVAMHELGHVLGLSHPDEHSQSVTALMNSRVSNLDTLAVDDIQGILSLYGPPPGNSGSAGMTINFPARDQTYDFRAWLETKYRDTLGRSQGSSYTDVEGSVVWVQEYLRYRLNACSHDQALERVRIQIAGGGVVSVCGTPASTTTISFPARDQTYAFRTKLEEIYRKDLGRSTVKTYVDAEGDVVWIQEYLRYRLNGCTHAQSVEKVSLQIDGQGVQPVCR